MFTKDQAPAGQATGAACGIKVPVRQDGDFTCRNCGAMRDKPEPHHGIMSIVCPAGEDGFVPTSQIPCLSHGVRGCASCAEKRRLMRTIRTT